MRLKCLYLLTYSTGDFNASKEIYKEDKIATNQNIPALVALAEKLKTFPTTKPQLPIIDRGFVLDTIIYNNFSRANLELVKKTCGFRNKQQIYY